VVNAAEKSGAKKWQNDPGQKARFKQKPPVKRFTIVLRVARGQKLVCAPLTGTKKNLRFPAKYCQMIEETLMANKK